MKGRRKRVIEDCFLEAGLNFDEAYLMTKKELTQEEKNRADRTIKIEKTPLWDIAGAAGDMQGGPRQDQDRSVR